MSDLKVTKPAAAPIKEQTATKENVVFSDAERNPSDWVITADGSFIRARHNNTRKEFQGTMADFNSKLRGK